MQEQHQAKFKANFLDHISDQVDQFDKIWPDIQKVLNLWVSDYVERVPEAGFMFGACCGEVFAQTIKSRTGFQGNYLCKDGTELRVPWLYETKPMKQSTQIFFNGLLPSDSIKARKYNLTTFYVVREDIIRLIPRLVRCLNSALGTKYKASLRLYPTYGVHCITMSPLGEFGCYKIKSLSVKGPMTEHDRLLVETSLPEWAKDFLHRERSRYRTVNENQH